MQSDGRHDESVELHNDSDSTEAEEPSSGTLTEDPARKEQVLAKSPW